MIAVVVAAVVAVLIVCGTLVTRWALKFAAEGAVNAPSEEPPEVDSGDEEAAYLSVRHLDGWDEMFFDGRMYRKCLSGSDPAYCRSSCGWLRYPEGVPLESQEWLKVHSEHQQRLAFETSSAAAIAARRKWGVPPRGAVFTHLEPIETARERAQEVRRREEEELDRRVEEALEATRKVDKL